MQFKWHPDESTFPVKASPRRLKPCKNLYCRAVQQNTSCPLYEDCTIILFDVTKKDVQKGCTEGCMENGSMLITASNFICEEHKHVRIAQTDDLWLGAVEL